MEKWSVHVKAESVLQEKLNCANDFPTTPIALVSGDVIEINSNHSNKKLIRE